MLKKYRTGLRPVGSKRTRVFQVGESALVAREAKIGDSLADELVTNLTDVGLDKLSGILARRGLEFGEVSEEGPTEHEGRAWLVYPVGNPRAVFEDS